MREGALKTVLSYGVGLSLGLLMVAPLINYTVPLLVNSYPWLYLVCASGFLGMFLLTTKVHTALKILITYLSLNCFISQVPYLSFNAFILVVASVYLLILFKVCEFATIVRFIEAAFWFQVILSSLQILGMDSLVNFRGVDFSVEVTGAITADPATVTPPVMMGTVMQYMRFGTLLAVAAPFLVWKDRRYTIPIAVVCVFLQSSTLALSLIVGAVVYLWFVLPRKKFMYCLIGALVVLCAYAAYDWGSIRGAVIPSNGGRLISWAYVVKTWLFDLSGAKAGALSAMNGPFNIGWFFFGHGMDTFLPLFPVYKHDANPFPQAHNDWLQVLWETGVVGFGLVSWYVVSLVRKLKNPLLLAGLACIGVNMFFAFPMRMTQTMFLIVAFLALCESEVDYAEVRPELFSFKGVLSS